MQTHNKMRTPWGDSQSATVLAPGIVRVETASHGGFKLTGAALAAIPMDWRKASFNEQGLNGWFEEDCDWCMVALIHPRCFTQAQVLQAAATFQHYTAQKLVAKDTP